MTRCLPFSDERVDGVVDSRSPAGLFDVELSSYGEMASEIAKQNRAARFNPQEIANTRLGLAKNAEGSKQLFDSLATMTLVLGAKSGGDLTRAGFTPQELSNLAWAYACVPDRRDGALLRKLWNAVSRSRPTTPPSASRSKN